MTLRKKLDQEVARQDLERGYGADNVVASATLDQLPPAVQRYLAFMGVEGEPRETWFRIAWDGKFRTKPSMDFLTCHAWQHNTSVGVARIFVMRAKMLGLVSIVARDTLVRGKGRMLVRLFDAITLEDAQGRELDVGELVTYVNDALLLCPSMLLNDAVEWKHVSDDSFDVSLRHGALRVAGRVGIDARGAVTNFTTEDRFCVDPTNPTAGPIRTRWCTPIAGWSHHNGRPFPTSGRAVWHLPDGAFVYAELVPRPATYQSNAARNERRR